MLILNILFSVNVFITIYDYSIEHMLYNSTHKAIQVITKLAAKLKVTHTSWNSNIK